MSMSMLHVHVKLHFQDNTAGYGPVAWTWTYSFDMDMWNMDMDFQYGRGQIALRSMELDHDIQDGHAALIWTCSIDMDMQHGRKYEHAACTWPYRMFMSMLHVQSHAACPSPCCISESKLYCVPMSILVWCPYCKTMSIAHVYVQCCVSMSMLHYRSPPGDSLYQQLAGSWEFP